MTSPHLQARGLLYCLAGGRLIIRRGDQTLAALCIAPRIDGEQTRIDAWEKQAEDHFVASLGRGDTAHFALRLARPCFWLETARPFIRQLTYFSDGEIAGDRWHSFVPDEWDRTWERVRDVAVAASSNYVSSNPDGGDGAGMTDPGDLPLTWVFNVPAHLCAWEVGGEWLGLSLPHPHALGVVRYRMERERFSLAFDAVQASCPESGCPRVYFEAGLAEPYELCDRHYALSEELGLTKRRVTKNHPDWWAHPYYKSYDDMLRVEKAEGGYRGHFKMVDGKPRAAVTTERIKAWHATVEEKTGLRGQINVFFDQVYFYHYGGYDKVIEDLGGVEGLRATIDEWRARGVRTGLYLHLYTISKDSEFYKQHPDACVAPKQPGIEYRHGVPVGDSEVTFLDWTHPAAREFMLGVVEFLLSDAPRCLNADWLGINNNIGPDPRCYDFHDPDWGVGDLMQMKVLRLVYEKAKSVKPDCMVRRQSTMAPFMEPYCDEAQLCEEWNGSTLAWWRRARIATRLIKHNIIGFDPWFVTLTKGYEYYLGLAAVMVPATEATTHAIHPYMTYRPLQEKDFR